MFLLSPGETEESVLILPPLTPCVSIVWGLGLTMNMCSIQGTDEVTYKVNLLPAEGAVQVTDGAVNVLISLTSAVMREPAGKPIPSHVLVRTIFDPISLNTFSYLLCAAKYKRFLASVLI